MLETIISLAISSLLLVIILIYFSSLFNSIHYGVPQVATFNSDIIAMRKGLKKYKLKGKTIIDLGSGTGKMLRFFEREFGMKTTGYEVDPSNFCISKTLNFFKKFNAKILWKNIKRSDLTKTDFIYIYLFPEIIEKLEDHIFSTPKKGTIVFSNGFKIKNKKPVDIIKDENGKEEVYVYKV